ncbi:hypothetical protein D9758_018905 [Tetrapyrgos nigripes]|uniref:Uncharacterized protein n=1 Tax=Tetrapyrgos nigripes TaxID=182062 RepID=A0A8H5B8H7_9AGAR|nr:hypothetical protein D9758_018905 [Tetrapyrgos nigripes]
MELLRLYESTSPLRGHTPINMDGVIHHDIAPCNPGVSGEASEQFSRICLGGRVFVSTQFSFSFLLEFRGAWFGVFVKGGVGLVSGGGGGGGLASGVKVVKEGKRRVKGRLGSRAEDASLVLGFGASLSSAEHSLVLVSVSTMNNVTNGSWIIASYGAYLHIKLCDFGISGELVFIYTNTFAGTTSGLYRSALDDG